MLVVEVEENSHQTQEEMLAQVVLVAVELAVNKHMALLEFLPLAAALAQAECKTQVSASMEEMVVLVLL
jgi:hypothetical protein